MKCFLMSFELLLKDYVSGLTRLLSLKGPKYGHAHIYYAYFLPHLLYLRLLPVFSFAFMKKKICPEKLPSFSVARHHSRLTSFSHARDSLQLLMDTDAPLRNQRRTLTLSGLGWSADSRDDRVMTLGGRLLHCSKHSGSLFLMPFMTMTDAPPLSCSDGQRGPLRFFH